jgi:APA family basic amino acid/polyamine antiporter
VTGAFAAFLGGVFPIDVLGELVSIGTLLAFVLVCIGVIVLRYTDPERRRPFRVPFVHFVGIVGALLCVFVMKGLPGLAWTRFGWWLVIGLVLYFSYGYRRSKLRTSAS